MGKHKKSHIGRPESGWSTGHNWQGAGEWKGCLNPISSDYMGANTKGHEGEIEEEAEMSYLLVPQVIRETSLI